MLFYREISDSACIDSLEATLCTSKHCILLTLCERVEMATKVLCKSCDYSDNRIQLSPVAAEDFKSAPIFKEIENQLNKVCLILIIILNDCLYSFMCLCVASMNRVQTVCLLWRCMHLHGGNQI